MQQRTALIVASTITAFTLVVVGGVAARVTQPTAAASTPEPVTSPTPDASAQTAYLQQVDAYYQARDAAYQQQAAAYQQQASTYQQHESVYQQRDLAYQQLIRQANEQLQLAYHQMMANKKRAPVHAQAPAPAVVQPTATPSYAVSADGAAAIALAASSGAKLLASPELVDFQGTVAYEVRLDRGNIYVDATTGNILYNGAPVPAAHTSNASQPQNPPGGNNTHSDDGNHSGGDDGGGD